MAFVQTKSSLKQTAFNVAATITAAFVNAGLVSSTDDARIEFREWADETFADLEGTHEAESSSPAPTTTSKPRASKSSAKSEGGSSNGSADPADFVVNFGAFKGLTLAQIAALSAEDALAKSEERIAEGWSGKPYEKPGVKYIEYLANTTSPKMGYAKQHAAAFLDSKRA